MFAAVRSASSSRAAARLARPISSTPLRASGSSTRHGNDPVVLETEKAKNLEGKQSSPHKDTAPGWNEKLASDSESAVKADRSEHGSPKDLQDKTVKQAHGQQSN